MDVKYGISGTRKWLRHTHTNLEHRSMEGMAPQMDTLFGSLHRVHWPDKDLGYRDESLLPQCYLRYWALGKTKIDQYDQLNRIISVCKLSELIIAAINEELMGIKQRLILISLKQLDYLTICEFSIKIYAFIYWLGTYHMLGKILGTRNTLMNKTDKSLI